MLRVVLASSSLLAAGALPAMPVAAAASVQPVAGQKCEETPARSTRRSILGGLGGAVAGNLLGSNRVTRTVGSFLPVQQVLTEAILNLLDCDEQKKAAKATEEATEQGEGRGVGATVAWRSDSRPGVSGSSTVTALDDPGADGRRCMSVTDVVIIDGEETTMPKRMCRTPPSRRYAKV